MIWVELFAIVSPVLSTLSKKCNRLGAFNKKYINRTNSTTVYIIKTENRVSGTIHSGTIHSGRKTLGFVVPNKITFTHVSVMYNAAFKKVVHHWQNDIYRMQKK